MAKSVSIQFEKDWNNPPKALSLSSVPHVYCPTCQLTWLVGEAGEDAARSHPSHHSETFIEDKTARSLFVFADGACSGNGTSDARAGMGVFFGPESVFNVSEPFMSKHPTNQKAELEAVSRSMEIVRLKVLPARKPAVIQSKGSQDSEAIFDFMQMRLVIVTDSST